MRKSKASVQSPPNQPILPRPEIAKDGHSWDGEDRRKLRRPRSGDLALEAGGNYLTTPRPAGMESLQNPGRNSNGRCGGVQEIPLRLAQQIFFPTPCGRRTSQQRAADPPKSQHLFPHTSSKVNFRDEVEDAWKSDGSAEKVPEIIADMEPHENLLFDSKFRDLPVVPPVSPGSKNKHDLGDSSTSSDDVDESR